MRNIPPNAWPARCPTCGSWNSGRSSPDRSLDAGSRTSVPRSSRSSIRSSAIRCVGGARAPAATNRCGTSSSHAASARSRRTCTTPADQAFVRRLALESDLLIENFRPGRLEQWNLDPEDLIAANPRLIVVRISGYGQTGPLREQPGFGTIAEAAGGLRYITGEPDGPPTRVGLSLGRLDRLDARPGRGLDRAPRARAVRSRPGRRCRPDRVAGHDAGVGHPRVRIPRDDPRTDRQHRPQLGADERVPVCGRRVRLHRREHDEALPGAVPGDRPRGLRGGPGTGENKGRVRRADELDCGDRRLDERPGPPARWSRSCASIRSR